MGNRIELYVCMCKEPVRKYMRGEDSHMVFWDYCDELRAYMTNMTAKDLF